MKKVFFSMLASAFLVAGCSYSVDNTVLCVQLDPLEKVYTEESYFVENPETAAVAKGETATFQFVIRCVSPIEGLSVEAGNLTGGDRQIAATLKAFVGYVRAGMHAGVKGQQQSKDAVYPVSDYYPDCLQEIASVDLQPLQNQPVWVAYTIPRDAAAGDYAATLTFTGKVNGKQFKITKEVTARVYPVTLPEQTLWVTNWFGTEGFSKMNGDQPVEPYSDRYWELLTAIVNVMRDHGQNTYWITDWFKLCDIQRTDETNYSFDFTNFDRMVELLIREGGLKRIEGTHLSRWGQKGGDPYLIVDIPKTNGLTVDDSRAQNYLSQFLPALYSHLKTKGWEKMYMQHICDEPPEAIIPSYIRVAGLVKKHMPGIPVIDAISVSDMPGFTNAVDVWVPLLSEHPNHIAFFRERQAAGDEVWYYTCCAPQANFANRFLELPLIQTRFLHWLNYYSGTTGYLHWGFNWWHFSMTGDAACKSISWPGGDAWVVYPADGKVYTSIRLAAMRDGIADYELLKLLAQQSPEKAKQITGEPIKDFDSYNNNVRAFRLTRLKLLEALSN